MGNQQAGTGGTWRMVAAMALSGTIGWFVVTSGQPTIDVVFFRCLLGGASLLSVLTLQRGWVRMDNARMGWLALGGVTLILNWLCLFSAYAYSGISIATVVYHTQPFFLLILTAVFQREPFPFGRLPWLLLAFAGVMLITGLEHGAQGTAMLAGIGLAMLAALLYAITTMATRRLQGIPPGQIAGLQMVIGVLMLAPLAHPAVGTLTGQAWGALLALGLIHTGVMYTLLYGAFQRLSVVSIATLSFIYPLVAIVIDVAVFDVVLGPLQLAGMALVLLGVIANQLGWSVPLRTRARG
ncbi:MULTISPECIES: DMT family transporter [Cupriavidus]|uniref:EamA domain-containing protein n=1 Tax=Cupriavidus pinatubonensis (strain JMP 134 / LMG 1197) TaxID=264198 RepID=Q476W2_CUPPJ|nr:MULTISPECIES: DMT family transporter [Cupriavidus]QYY31811.1 DMT family transporter [Cupriavidus pinatubonensis]TPQ42118.1 EamA/RhaT family transporter [Cupriavidus pinatubonensis]